MLLSSLLAFASALPVSAVSVPAQEGQAKGSVHLEVDRSRRCGLGATFHAGRRAALRAKLGTGLVLVRGMPPTRDYTEAGNRLFGEGTTSSVNTG
jgi:hypothetical protein